MKKYLFTLAITLTITFAYSNISFAVCGGGPLIFFCNANAPNPDLNGIQEAGNNGNLTIDVLPGAEIDTRTASGGNGLDGIKTGDGNNLINVNNGSVAGQLSAIETEAGNDELNITDSEVTHAPANNTIDTGLGNDLINVIRSNIFSEDDRVISAGGGDDTVNVIDSEVKALEGTGSNAAIDTGGGVDNVFVENSLVRGTSQFQPLAESVDLKPGNDTLTIGSNAVLRGLTVADGEGPGLIDCGSDFDTIVFAMDVPEEAVGAISTQILQAGLPEGSITINGLFYIWEDCELLIPQLNGVREVRPIPTISQWGYIAMAGVLGIVGFITIHRRKAAA